MERSEWEDSNADGNDDETHEAVGSTSEGSTSGVLSGEQALTTVITLAERYHDRVDAAQFLELLPMDTPVAALLGYFGIVLEYGSTKKRNLQVCVERPYLLILFNFKSHLMRTSLIHCTRSPIPIAHALTDHPPVAEGARGADPDKQLTVVTLSLH